MLILMRKDATEEQVRAVEHAIERMGFAARPMPGEQRIAIGVVGNDRRVDDTSIRGLDGVLEIVHVSAPYKQVSREWKPEPTVITLANGTRIGGDELVVMAGPCAVESREQLLTVADYVAAAGATVLRGGAYKPRTSPYAFQGMGPSGLQLLAEARERTGLAIVTEALDIESADAVAEVADIIQIGARNMQNFALLRHIGKLGKPVMLKRGPSATIKEWLLAAEYLLAEGNADVMLCERGIRSFDDATRNVMDVTAIPLVQSLSHLPVVADPSHATGVRALVAPVAKASVAAGAQAIIVETHPDPRCALSDGPQALTPSDFRAMMTELAAVANALGRGMATLP